MSFIEWAKANPTKTWGYKNLQKRLDNARQSLKAEEAELGRLNSGGMPSYFEEDENQELGSIFVMGQKLFLTSIEELPVPGETELEAQVRRKQRQQERWTREAIEADERKQRRRKIFHDSAVENQNRRVQKDKERIAELTEAIAAFEIPPSELTWRDKGYYDQYEGMITALRWRIGSLWDIEWESKYSVVEFCKQIQAVSVDGFRLSFVFMLKDDNWWVTVSDGKVSFTRRGGVYEWNDGIFAVLMIPLLTYLDTQWDNLIGANK